MSRATFTKKKRYFVVLTGFGHEIRDYVMAKSKADAEAKIMAKYGVSVSARNVAP